jgi:hypothetical protein
MVDNSENHRPVRRAVMRSMLVVALVAGSAVGGSAITLLTLRTLWQQGYLGPVPRSFDDAFGQMNHGFRIHVPGRGLCFEGLCYSNYAGGPRRYQTEYKDGKENGVRIDYFATGSVYRIIHYRADAPDGVFMIFDVYGRPQEIGQYDHDKLIWDYKYDLGAPPKDPIIRRLAEENEAGIKKALSWPFSTTLPAAAR